MADPIFYLIFQRWSLGMNFFENWRPIFLVPGFQSVFGAVVSYFMEPWYDKNRKRDIKNAETWASHSACSWFQ
jgi:hypothetical protein